MTEVQRINSFLKKFRGVNPNGDGNYRLVWSDKEYELRLGTYNDFTDSGLFLRQVRETRRTRKYSYISERWILEKWVPPPGAYNSELPESISGAFEPFYVFEDSKGNYLAPVEKVVIFLIEACEKVPRVTKNQRIRDLIAEAKDQEQAEYQYFYDAIDSSEISIALHLKEGIVRP